MADKPVKKITKTINGTEYGLQVESAIRDGQGNVIDDSFNTVKKHLPKVYTIEDDYDVISNAGTMANLVPKMSVSIWNDIVATIKAGNGFSTAMGSTNTDTFGVPDIQLKLVTSATSGSHRAGIYDEARLFKLSSYRFVDQSLGPSANSIPEGQSPIEGDLEFISAGWWDDTYIDVLAYSLYYDEETNTSSVLTAHKQWDLPKDKIEFGATNQVVPSSTLATGGLFLEEQSKTTDYTVEKPYKKVANNGNEDDKAKVVFSLDVLDGASDVNLTEVEISSIVAKDSTNLVTGGGVYDAINAARHATVLNVSASQALNGVEEIQIPVLSVENIELLAQAYMDQQKVMIYFTPTGGIAHYFTVDSANYTTAVAANHKAEIHIHYDIEGKSASGAPKSGESNCIELMYCVSGNDTVKIYSNPNILAITSLTTYDGIEEQLPNISSSLLNDIFNTYSSGRDNKLLFISNLGEVMLATILELGYTRTTGIYATIAWEGKIYKFSYLQSDEETEETVTVAKLSGGGSDTCLTLVPTSVRTNYTGDMAPLFSQTDIAEAFKQHYENKKIIHIAYPIPGYQTTDMLQCPIEGIYVTRFESGDTDSGYDYAGYIIFRIKGMYITRSSTFDHVDLDKRFILRYNMEGDQSLEVIDTTADNVILHIVSNTTGDGFAIDQTEFVSALKASLNDTPVYCVFNNVTGSSSIDYLSSVEVESIDAVYNTSVSPARIDSGTILLHIRGAWRADVKKFTNDWRFAVDYDKDETDLTWTLISDEASSDETSVVPEGGWKESDLSSAVQTKLNKQGTVTSVNNTSPDASGNVTLTIPNGADYLKLDGSSSMTGNIKYANGGNAYDMISFKTGDQYGAGILVGGGGCTVIGAGESANTVYSGASLTAGDESLRLTADSSIYFYSNCNSSYSSAKIMTYDTNGKLTVPGDLKATNVYADSDSRLKDNIKDNTFNSEVLLNNMKIRQFNWKNDPETRQNIGVIAQELQEILPVELVDEFILTNKETGYLAVNDSKLIYLLIDAYQREKATNINLEARLKNIEEKLGL